MTEVLVVLAIIGVFVTFTGIAFLDAYRAYQVRSASLELTTAMRAVRQVAVSTRTPRSLVIDQTAKTYTWTDSKDVVRTLRLPESVEFLSVSPTTITFGPTGTVTTGAATITVTNQVNSNRVDDWTLTLNTVGRVTTTYSSHTP